MKKILAILLALTLVLSVGVAAMAEEETELWGEGLKIGLAQMHYTNAFRIAETESVISAFEAVGAEVVWNEAGNDTATQVANAKDLLAQDIDYLLLPPKEEAGLVPALDAAKEAGVPVILLDRSANGEPGVDYVTAIRSNAIAEGEWCAQWIIDNYPDGANIVEVFGAPGSTTAMDRAEGFWNLLAEAGDQYVKLDSQVGDNMRDTAQKVTENMIQAHGSDIDIIVTHSDEMTFGTLQAIEGMGYVAGEDFKVLSIGDGASALLEAIIDGRVAACSECSPLLGPQAVEVVKTLEEGGTVEGLIWANDRFFTIENAAEELENAGW